MSRPRNIPISVTQSDIDNGKVSELENCPVALACRRTLNHPVQVSRYSIQLKGDGLTPLPDVARKFVLKFDLHDHTVTPFRFKLPLTAEQVAFLKL